jgi:hypothetical protein
LTPTTDIIVITVLKRNISISIDDMTIRGKGGNGKSYITFLHSQSWAAARREESKSGAKIDIKRRIFNRRGQIFLK